MKVRIISTPQGEAPFDVRKAWIGLELEGRPYDKSEGGYPVGILSLEKVSRDYKSDFICDSKYAVARLKTAGKDYAYAWWVSNFNFSLMPRFMFDRECFEVIGG